MGDPHHPTLYICIRCRDGRETTFEDDRGGARLAAAVIGARAARTDLPPHTVTGVHCMSQCKRPCTVALQAPGRYTYVFGDLDPGAHAGDILDLLALYAAEPLGFLPSDRRPRAMQAGILGRIPPLGVVTDLLDPLPLPSQDSAA